MNYYQPVIYKAWLNDYKPDEKTIINVAASVASHDYINRNLAASKGGFFGSKKFNFDYENQKLAKAEAAHLARLLPFKAHIEHAREAAAQAGDNRLDKGRKSPTEQKQLRKRMYKQRAAVAMLAKHNRKDKRLVSSKGFDNWHNGIEREPSNWAKREKTKDGLFFTPVSFSIEKTRPQIGENDLLFSPVVYHVNKPAFEVALISPLKNRIHLQKRDWSNEYRLQQVFQPRPSDAPEQQAGDRFTDKLTSRAVTKIFESGAYVSACKGGFKTFGTLTFDEQRRRRVLGLSDTTADGLPYCPLKADKKGQLVNPNTTMGAEVARFFDGIKKLYQRGVWLYETAKDSDTGAEYCPITPIHHDAETGAPYSRIETNFSAPDVARYDRRWVSTAQQSDDFLYLWVAECPANEITGEVNPHIHFLMKWNVEKSHFRAWAERVESIWGNGFCKLERIRKAEAAGGYLIKAIGYAAKGKNANQGIIKGNRYNMARAARAPSWETLQTFDADNMAGIIKEMAYKLEQWKKPLQRQIRKAEALMEQSKKAAAIKKQQNDRATLARLNNRITKLENQIKDNMRTIKGAGIFASTANRFSVTFSESTSGKSAESRVNQFLNWAAGARGWSMNAQDCDFSDIREIAAEQYAREFEQFQDTKFYWRAVLLEPLPPMMDADELERQKSAGMRDFEHYATLNL